ncbi:hypothetical protein [Pontibacter sp. G13]|uniref:hypothetical protein n=1 Tax=Pontibacter sp. G13 TaxID=3074898 RepID=UPI00288B9FC5|nr:hypothetical protein [Pontibacter sp. G13]WNJ19644.1 hypothetical protein RJD25_04090 [Pontibacter sp. G13]
MKQPLPILVVLWMWISISAGVAQVKYQTGMRVIDGVQLLQDSNNDNFYRYIPQFPRFSMRPDSTFELLCMKYVGTSGASSNGGIFHALVEFSLPPAYVKQLEVELQREVPEAQIVGPVQLMQADEDDSHGTASFEVVSAILTNTEGDNPFTRNVITSGFAPLLPGSKAAIAANLNQTGASLLWESLQSPTSDVSVSISGYYEAVVEGYNAVVSGEVETIYEHFSQIRNKSEGYKKRQLRNIADELVQEQLLNVEVFDRSEGLGISTKAMADIVELVTDKLIELMFDAETGWSQVPDREVAVEPGQLLNRQERSWLSKTFSLKTDNTPYYTDNQFVLKKREDIRAHRFYMNLSQKTTIKVPIHTAGNLGGIYGDWADEELYFKIVNLGTDFQSRDVHFQVDGRFAGSFDELINSVSVEFRQEPQGDQAMITESLMFRAADLENQFFKTIQYPRLEDEGDDWLNYDYRISWNIKGMDEPVNIPSFGWASSQANSIALIPPIDRKEIEIDADRASFEEAGIHSASIKFMVMLGGKPQVQETMVLRAKDAENTNAITLYGDPDQAMAYQVTWHTKEHGSVDMPVQLLEDEYMFILPPADLAQD